MPGHRLLTPLVLALPLRPSQNETPLKEAVRPVSPPRPRSPTLAATVAASTSTPSRRLSHHQGRRRQGHGSSAARPSRCHATPHYARPPATLRPRAPPTPRLPAARPRCPLATRPPYPTVSIWGWHGAVLGVVTTSGPREGAVWQRRTEEAPRLARLAKTARSSAHYGQP